MCGPHDAFPNSNRSQEKLRKSLESEVSKGNEAFKSLPHDCLPSDEIRARLRYKVRRSYIASRGDSLETELGEARNQWLCDGLLVHKKYDGVVCTLVMSLPSYDAMLVTRAQLKETFSESMDRHGIRERDLHCVGVELVKDQRQDKLHL